MLYTQDLGQENIFSKNKFFQRSKIMTQVFLHLNF